MSQSLGQPLPAGAPLEAQFGLGNSSTVAKTIRVVLADGDFSESKTCSFAVPAGTPLTTYRMQALTTEAWSNASIHFYADTPGTDGGFNLVDNATVIYDPSAPAANDSISPPPASAGTCVLNPGAPGFVPLSTTLSAIRMDDTCRYVYALDKALNRVNVYPLSSRSFVAPIAVGAQPVDFDITPDGSTMYRCEQRRRQCVGCGPQAGC